MTATVSPELNVAEALRTGPASILDFHVGSLDDLRAPDWVHWTRNTLSFASRVLVSLVCFLRWHYGLPI
jgi:hypothetical protein